MNNMFRKVMYFGFGALTTSQERAERFFDEMVEKGEITKEEAMNFIDEAREKSTEQQAEVKEMIKTEVENLQNQYVLVHRSELEALENRITELEKKLKQE